MCCGCVCRPHKMATETTQLKHHHSGLEKNEGCVDSLVYDGVGWKLKGSPKPEVANPDGHPHTIPNVHRNFRTVTDFIHRLLISPTPNVKPTCAIPGANLNRTQTIESNSKHARSSRLQFILKPYVCEWLPDRFNLKTRNIWHNELNLLSQRWRSLFNFLIFGGAHVERHDAVDKFRSHIMYGFIWIPITVTA